MTRTRDNEWWSEYRRELEHRLGHNEIVSLDVYRATPCNGPFTHPPQNFVAAVSIEGVPDLINDTEAANWGSSLLK
jgi:hypothetical protein